MSRTEPSEVAPMCGLFAASYPDRTHGLILYIDSLRLWMGTSEVGQSLLHETLPRVRNRVAEGHGRALGEG